MIDATAFAKHIVRGPGATAFLDWFTCNRLPKPGKINLTYALTDIGTVHTEFTILRLDEESYYLVSAGAWGSYDGDNLRKAIADRSREFGYVECHDVSSQWGVFAIAGKNSRRVLKRIIRNRDPQSALGNSRFPWLSCREIELGMCPVRAIRVAYTGELGWELHHPIEMQNYLWDLLLSAGKEYDLKLVGARAQNWLRLEKSYRAFGNELGRDATAVESGLERFIDFSKDFRGCEMLQSNAARFKCCTLLIDGPTDADPGGREALYYQDEQVGRLTSGGYSVTYGKSIGMGYLPIDLAVPGEKLSVKMFNNFCSAEVVEESPYDPVNRSITVDG